MAGIGGWAGPRGHGDASALARLAGGAAATCWTGDGIALAWAPRRGLDPTDPGARGGLAVGDDLVVAFDGTLADPAPLAALVERRGLLATRGHDAELILLAWRALGPAALDRLEGTFGLAVWSRADRALVLVRDRLGGGSLAWTHDGAGVVFSSDLVALAGSVGAARDSSRVFELLLQGHASPPATLFVGVRALEPGNMLRVGPSGTARPSRYFAPSFIQRTEPVEALGERLGQVVRAHVERDGAGVVLLDGGLGGAAIAHAAGGRLPTVSVASDGVEDLGARQAEVLGTRHQVVPLAPESVSIAELVRTHGGPFATAMPLVAEALRGHSVVYAGLGAETLAGLPPTIAAATRGGRLGPRAGRLVRRASELAADVTLSPLRRWLESLAELGGASEVPLSRRLLATEGVFPPDVLASIVRPRHRDALFGVAAWSEQTVAQATADTQVGRGLAWRLRSGVVERLAPGLGQGLRSAGVELRLPLFDQRCGELATGLSPSDRSRALARTVPDALPFEADPDRLRLARWMGGALERSWRDAVFAEASPLAELVDLARIRALLLAEEAWNPGRWRQALALWTLGLWLAR